jgi:SPP1 gp7 family putative phage head morphogenesis protein
MDPYQAAERFRQEAEGLDREAITALVRAYGDVWQRLDRELLSLRALLPAEGEAAPRPVTLLQLERVEALRGQIAQALAELVPYADEQALTAEQRALVLGQAHAQALLRAAAGPGVTASFARFDPEAARALVGFLQNGAPLRALFERLAAGTADAAGRALLAGVAAGTPYSAVARELRGVLGTSLAHAITITRTETHRAYREAHHLTYQANADLVRGWVWLSARGPRTCATCWALHGTFHPLDERQLGHPRCRCTSVPVTRPWSQLGVPGAGPTHPPVELGVDAFAHAPEEVQRAVLGPQKFQAYKEGRIGLEDLAVFRPDPVWGGAWVEPSLRQALAQHLDEKPWLRATPPPPPVRHPAFRRGRSAPPEPAPEPQPVPAGPFPASLEGLTVVRRLGGSTGAELVRDELGRTFVRKRGASPEHLREEVLADTLYRALGANVPLARLYETPQGPVKLAQVVEGESLDAVLKAGDAARIARVRKNLQQHLAADALLGNWDVIGLKRDNILVDAQDNVWRIDNGGALRYRAQGAPKGEAWDGHLRDLFTLRDPARNREAAAVFREVPWRDVVGQLHEVAALRDHVLEIAPPELREALASRLDEARHLAEVGQRMLDDHFTEAYVEEFSRHIVGLRAADVVDALPRKLEPAATQADDVQ